MLLKNDHKTLAEAEEFLAEQTILEYLYVFDAEKKQIAKIKGTENKVQIPLKILAKLSDCIITHNHPQGTSFSIDDVEMALVYNLKELRAVTHSSTYILKRPQDGWHINMNDNEVKEIYLALENITIQALSQELREGKINFEYFDKHCYHFVWSKFFANFGITYIKINNEAF